MVFLSTFCDMVLWQLAKKIWLSACQSRCWLDFEEKNTFGWSPRKTYRRFLAKICVCKCSLHKIDHYKNFQLGLRIGFGTGESQLGKWYLKFAIISYISGWEAEKKDPSLFQGFFPFFVPLGELSPLWASGQHAWRQISRCRRRIPREAWGILRWEWGGFLHSELFWKKKRNIRKKSWGRPWFVWLI